MLLDLVTLHVSVWVEILYICLLPIFDFVTLHVSVWVEIYKIIFRNFKSIRVTLHVSVWVEIFTVKVVNTH